MEVIWAISRLGCSIGGAAGIFPVGTYYPQVHPQPVENSIATIGATLIAHASHRRSDMIDLTSRNIPLGGT